MMYVDESLCTGCGICVDACTQGAISSDACRASIDPVLCTSCGCCIDACRTDAIVSVETISEYPIATALRAALRESASPNADFPFVAGRGWRCGPFHGVSRAPVPGDIQARRCREGPFRSRDHRRSRPRTRTGPVGRWHGEQEHAGCGRSELGRRRRLPFRPAPARRRRTRPGERTWPRGKAIPIEEIARND